MSYTLTFTFQSDAPYSADELLELQEELFNFVREGDDDIIDGSDELTIENESEASAREAKENEKRQEIVTELLKNSIVDVKVKVTDEDGNELIDFGVTGEQG